MNKPSRPEYSTSGLTKVHDHQFEKTIPPELLALINKLQTNYPFFSEMGDKEVGQFLKLCKQENFKEGDIIFREGDSGNDFYLIVSGEISIQVEENEVARIKQGQIFGEMAMLDDATRTASAIAAGPSLVFSITRDILGSKMPKFANKVIVSIARQLSDKLREANGTIKTLQRQLDEAAEFIRKLSAKS